MMTREDKLYSMKGDMLIKEADKLGVKVACNKNRTQLKESKQAVVYRILAFEASQVKEEVVEHKLVPMPGIEKLAVLKKEYSHEEDVSVDEVVETVVDNESDKVNNTVDTVVSSNVSDFCISNDIAYKSGSRKGTFYIKKNKLSLKVRVTKNGYVVYKSGKFDDGEYFENTKRTKYNLKSLDDILVLL